jgi:hypothetical protein
MIYINAVTQSCTYYHDISQITMHEHKHEIDKLVKPSEIKQSVILEPPNGHNTG